MLETSFSSENIDFNYGELDDPGRLPEIKKVIQSKPALVKFYDKIYSEYRKSWEKAPSPKFSIELGSGASFAKNYIPTLIYTDILDYEGIDQVVDATKMPFADNSVNFICMLNTLHHVPDTEKFFYESQRVLSPGGRMLIADQHVGFISYFALKFLHHEGFNLGAKSWAFPSSGPLSSANGALSWIIFKRDFKKFGELFPQLKVNFYRTHSPLWYWFSGGLKKWNLIPKVLFPVFSLVEKVLLALSPNFGSFNFVEIEKVILSKRE